MFIKSLHLKNIRSYNDLELEFPSGTTLLSGDIGSGKTTILLSVEFALFGVMRGLISGSSLLRHGQKEGSVTLTFNIGKTEYVVKRSLKRLGKTVSQDSGHISINGEVLEATPTELKSKVLEILGYPGDLVGKTLLIYRYTVYAAQEEMKYIIYERPEERLEQIRKIFDIEKYTRIRENASFYAKETRTRIRGLKENIKDEEKLEALRKETKQISSRLEDQLKKILFEITKNKSDLDEVKKKIAEYELTMESLNNARKESAVIAETLSSLEETLRRNRLLRKKREEEVERDKKVAKKPEASTSPETLREEKHIFVSRLEDTQQKYEIASKNMAVIKSSIENLKNETLKMIEMHHCPTCDQEVSKEHKQRIKEKSNKKVSELKTSLEKYSLFAQKAKSNISLLRKRIEESDKKIEESILLAEQRKSFEETQRRIKVAKEELETLKDEEKKIRLQIDGKKDALASLKKTLEELKKDSENITSIKQDEARLMKKFNELSINKARLETQKENNYEKLKKTEEELKEVKVHKSLIQELIVQEDWLTSHFSKLVMNIEKHVMRSIHQEFNDTFQEWFNTLLEDEEIHAHLDESFAPLISQNGYETEVSNLSGGEKTSVALAYRLALNKVINNYISTIKTRGLIILDEPTDGFSMDQLDRVRDVLEQLNNEQTIIVSHEPKLESMVEHIVRISKDNHVSVANYL